MSEQTSLDEMAPELFALTPAVDSAEVGYRVPAVLDIVGVTYRQLDYWARTGLVEPSVQAASGSGSQRLYGFTDLLALKVVKRLLDAGVSLRNIRTAVECLRARGLSSLTHTTLVSDGTTVYECTSDNEVIDLLHGGQGVFGIAVGAALTDLAGSVAGFPSEPAAADRGDLDELADRRSRRRSA